MNASAKTIFTTLMIVSTCCGCIQHIPPRVTVNPKHFSIQIPFQTDSKGIVIATYWGADKTEHKLYLDNHSPTWASSNIIRGNRSISKSKDFLYSTTTADGKVIAGEVYVCDNISIGQVNFINVPFYNISNETNTGKTDGAIGENIMSEGIWKIDFKNHVINFASSIDSIKGLQEAGQLPAVFTSNAIEIEVSFRNKIMEKFELDLGYNGSAILPVAEFEPIVAGNKKVYTAAKRFSTPAGAVTIDNTIAVDSIRIGHQPFIIAISTNKLVKEKLLGRNFFDQFEFIVIDYPGKAVYLSKKQLYDTPEMK